MFGRFFFLGNLLKKMPPTNIGSPATNRTYDTLCSPPPPLRQFAITRQLFFSCTICLRFAELSLTFPPCQAAIGPTAIHQSEQSVNQLFQLILEINPSSMPKSQRSLHWVLLRIMTAIKPPYRHVEYLYGFHKQEKHAAARRCQSWRLFTYLQQLSVLSDCASDSGSTLWIIEDIWLSAFVLSSSMDEFLLYAPRHLWIFRVMKRILCVWLYFLF